MEDDDPHTEEEDQQLTDEDELTDEELYEDLDTYLRERFNSQLSHSLQTQLPKTECSLSNSMIFPSTLTLPTYSIPTVLGKSKSTSLRRSTISQPHSSNLKYPKCLRVSTRTLPRPSLE